MFHKGGKNFESCVPDGTYLLQPWDSSNHPNSFIISNEELDVYKGKDETRLGRWGILIHTGNYLRNIVGCIAPGLVTDEEHVWHSELAMNKLRRKLKKKEHTLVIQPKGTRPR